MKAWLCGVRLSFNIYILNESLAVWSQAFIFTINKTGLSLFVRSGKE